MLKLSAVLAAAALSVGMLAAPVSATVTSPLPLLTANPTPHIEKAAVHGTPHGFHRRWIRHRGWGWRHRGWGGPYVGFGYGYPYYYPYGYPYYGPTIGFGIRIH